MAEFGEPCDAYRHNAQPFLLPLGGSVAVSFCPPQCSHHFSLKLDVDDSYFADGRIVFMGDGGI